MLKLESCSYPPVFSPRSRFVLGKLCFSDWGLSYKQNLVHGERTFRNRAGPYAFCSGNTLGKPFPGYRFKVGPYQFCSGGNPTTLPTQLWSYLIFSNIHMTFYGQWHIFRVRCQPPCSGSFACLGNHPSLATRKDATVEVVLARCHRCSSKLCLSFEAAVQESQLCDCYNVAGSKMVVDRECSVQKTEAAKL